MKKKLLALLLTAVMSTAVLAGCGGSKQEAPATPSTPDPDAPAAAGSTDTPYTIKLASVINSESYKFDGLKKFKEIVEAESNGSLTVELYADSTLGGQSEVMEGMGMNTIEMAYISTGAAEAFFPEIGVPGLLFLAENEEHALALWRSDYAKDVLERMAEATNIRCLDFSLEGTRHVWTIKPIAGLADLAGLKLRVPEVPMFINAFTALGANPTPMAFSEVYTGLQTKIIDGLEYDIGGMRNNHLDDLCKYCYETSHGVSVMSFMIADSLWNQLSDNQRAVITKAAAEASAQINADYYTDLEASRAALAESGVTFVTPSEEDRAKMAELLQPVLEELIDGRCSQEQIDALRNLRS